MSTSKPNDPLYTTTTCQRDRQRDTSDDTMEDTSSDALGIVDTVAALEFLSSFNMPIYIPVTGSSAATHLSDLQHYYPREGENHIIEIHPATAIEDVEGAPQKTTGENSGGRHRERNLFSTVLTNLGLLHSDEETSIFLTNGNTGGKKTRKEEKKYGISYAELLTPTWEASIPLYRLGALIDLSTYRGIPMLGVPLEAVTGDKRIKDSINLAFHKTNPWLHKTLTMSKLRNLKCDLFGLVDRMPGLEPSTVAMAWIYFERLVLRRCVHKINRKQFAGACLMLAFKFNEALKHDRLGALSQTIQTLDRKDHLSAHDIFVAEFKVFAMIGFGLRLSFRDIAPHLLEYFYRKERLFEAEYGFTPEEFDRTETIPLEPL